MARVPSLLTLIYNWSKHRFFRFLLLALVALWCLDALIFFFTEAQWHSVQGYANAWWRGIFSGGLLFLATFALILFCGMQAVRELVAKSVPPLDRHAGLLAQAAVIFAAQGQRLARWAVVLVAFFAARAVAAHWMLPGVWNPTFRLGPRDPFYGRDVAFYLFRLPLYHALTDSLWRANSWLLLVCLLLFAGRYTLDRVAGTRTPRKARLWVYSIGSCWFFLLALRYYWSQFDLATALHPEAIPDGETVRAGIGYVDWYVRRPAAWLGAALSLFTGGMLLRQGLAQPRFSRLRGWRWNGDVKKFAWLTGAACFLPGFIAIFLGGFVQRFVVEPNTAFRETPFLKSQDDATRLAWQLPESDRPASGRAVTPSSGQPKTTPSAASPSTDTGTHARVWDVASLRAALCRNDDETTCPAVIEFDRYEVEEHATLVAVASYDGSNRLEAGKTALRLFSATATTGEGAPLPLDLSAKTTGKLSLGQSYESGFTSQSWPWRLLWAWRLRNLRVLRAVDVNPTDASVEAVHSFMVERATRTAPFLVPVAEPYPVLENGRIFWILDLAVAGARYPGARATRLGNDSSSLFNVARDSVKMVMESRGGRVWFFAASRTAETEPLLLQWQRAFPGLIQSFASMPVEVQRHRRYPRRLFAAQVALLQALEGWKPLEPDFEYSLPQTNADAAELALSTLLVSGGLYKVLSCSSGSDTYGTLQFVDYEAGNVGRLLTRLQTVPVPEETAERYFERGPVSVLPAAGRLQLVQPIYAFSLHRNAGSTPGEAERQVRLWRVAVGDSATQKVSLRLPQPGEPAARPATNRATLAREALRLHEAAQRAAAEDWQRAAKLWQQLHQVLQQLAAEP